MASSTDGLKRKDMFQIDPNFLVIIGADTEDGPSHPLYDGRINLPIDESMVLNIARIGVIEPVVVKKDGDRFLVIDGRQRVRHARVANTRLIEAGNAPITVPIIVYRADEKTTIGAMVSLNEVRRQDGYQQRAERCRRMIEINGMSEGDCALYFGVHVQTINQWMAWFDLAPEAQAAVAQGALTATSATKLAKLPQEKQKEHVARIKDEVEKNGGKKVSGREVEAAARGETQVHIKPSVKRIREVAAKCSPDVRAALLWTLGEGAAPGGAA